MTQEQKFENIEAFYGQLEVIYKQIAGNLEIKSIMQTGNFNITKEGVKEPINITTTPTSIIDAVTAETDVLIAEFQTLCNNYTIPL